MTWTICTCGHKVHTRFLEDHQRMHDAEPVDPRLEPSDVLEADEYLELVRND